MYSIDKGTRYLKANEVQYKGRVGMLYLDAGKGRAGASQRKNGMVY